jgi:CcmD family protein
MSIGIVWAGVFIYLLWLHLRIGKLQSELRQLTAREGHATNGE